MSETLNDFLVDLASDRDRMQAFLSNPTLVLDQSSLPAKAKAAVLSRDARAIRTAMGMAPAAASENFFMKKSGTKKGGAKKKGGKKKGGTKKR